MQRNARRTRARDGDEVDGPANSKDDAVLPGDNAAQGIVFSLHKGNHGLHDALI